MRSSKNRGAAGRDEEYMEIGEIWASDVQHNKKEKKRKQKTCNGLYAVDW